MKLKLLSTIFSLFIMTNLAFAQEVTPKEFTSKTLKSWVESQSGSSQLLDLQAQVKSILNSIDVLYISTDCNISGESGASIEKIANIFDVYTAALANAKEAQMALGIVDLKMNIVISNELADLLSFKNNGVLPFSLVGKSVFVVRDEITSIEASDGIIATLHDLVQSKLNKKAAEENSEDDFTLRINIIYYDSDFVQHDELASNPTAVTTGAIKTFKAKGGSGDYIWYLDTNNDSEISGTGDTITYRANGESRAGTDTLYLNDGFEEVSISISSGLFRTEQDGSGAKGNKSGGCFIRSKNRD